MVSKDEPSRKLRVFLCHSSSDKPAVRALYQRLQADGFEPWLDEEELIPGQRWQKEIPKAVRGSDVVLVCLSSGSVTKEGYIQKEIRFALDAAEEKLDDTIFLIPLKLEPCDVPERLGEWHWVDFFDERGYERLLKSLRQRVKQLGIVEAPPPPAAHVPAAGRGATRDVRAVFPEARQTEPTHEQGARRSRDAAGPEVMSDDILDLEPPVRINRFHPVTPASQIDSTAASSRKGMHPKEQPVPSGEARTAPQKSAAPGKAKSATDAAPPVVSREEERYHNEARRFARLLVSEIKLWNEQKVREGRDASDLYDRLREVIDRSRQMYDKRVRPEVSSRYDYFDHELVNVLAEGDRNKLGKNYPYTPKPRS